MDEIVSLVSTLEILWKFGTFTFRLFWKIIMEQHSSFLLKKVSEKRSFHFYWSCVAFAGLLKHKTNDDLDISWCTRKSKSYVEKVLCIFPRTKACYAVRIESVFCCKVRYVIRFWTRTLPTVETVPCNTVRNGYKVQ